MTTVLPENDDSLTGNIFQGSDQELSKELIKEPILKQTFFTHTDRSVCEEGLLEPRDESLSNGSDFLGKSEPHPGLTQGSGFGYQSPAAAFESRLQAGATLPRWRIGRGPNDFDPAVVEQLRQWLESLKPGSRRMEADARAYIRKRERVYGDADWHSLVERVDELMDSAAAAAENSGDVPSASAPIHCDEWIQAYCAFKPDAWLSQLTLTPADVQGIERAIAVLESEAEALQSLKLALCLIRVSGDMEWWRSQRLSLKSLLRADTMHLLAFAVTAKEMGLDPEAVRASGFSDLQIQAARVASIKSPIRELRERVARNKAQNS
jgi:hypothetical protein